MDVLTFVNSLKLDHRRALYSDCLWLKPSFHSPLGRWWADVHVDCLLCDCLFHFLCFFLIAVADLSWSLCCVGLRLHCSPGWGLSLSVSSIRLPSASIATSPGAVPVVTIPRWQCLWYIWELNPPKFHISLPTKMFSLFISCPNSPDTNTH